jgi:hypothetical protein
MAAIAIAMISAMLTSHFVVFKTPVTQSVIRLRHMIFNGI